MIREIEREAVEHAQQTAQCAGWLADLLFTTVYARAGAWADQVCFAWYVR